MEGVEEMAKRGDLADATALVDSAAERRASSPAAVSARRTRRSAQLTAHSLIGEVADDVGEDFFSGGARACTETRRVRARGGRRGAARAVCLAVGATLSRGAVLRLPQGRR